MKKILLSILAILLLLPASIALASDISGSLYRMLITVTNSGTAATGVYAVATINTPNLIVGHFCSDDVTNIAMHNATGTDVQFMPGYETNPWVFFVPSISANAQINNTLYTSESSGGTLAYFPGDGGMTMPDSAGLELGNNFELEWSGYSDITTVANWVSKTDAITWGVSGSGQVTATMAGVGSPTNAYYLPSGPGAATNILSQYPASGAHWDKEDDPVASPDDNATNVYNGTYNTTQTDYYAVSCDSPPPTGSIINSVKVVVRSTSTTAEIHNAGDAPGVYLSGTVTWSEMHYPDEWTTYTTDALARPGGGTWSLSDLSSIQVGVQCYSYDSGTGYMDASMVTQLYILVNYSPPMTLTASGLSAGDHVYKLVANGSTLKQYVDDVEKASTSFSGSVPNSTDSWTLLQGAGYMNYWKLTVNGILKQHIEYEYHPVAGSTLTNGTGIATGSPNNLVYGNNTITVTQVGTFTVALPVGIRGTATSDTTTVTGSPQALVEGNNTVTATTSTGIFVINLYPIFHDLSGNGNHVTPSFRTMSSDADVSAAAVSFQPVSEAKAPVQSLSESVLWITDTPVVSGNFSTTGSTWNFPGADVVKALADASVTPSELPMNLMAGFVILAMSFSMSAILRKNLAASLFAKGFLIALLMGIAGALKVFDFWMLVLFVYFAVTIALISSDPRWG
jgi:hypothetical protein